MLRKSLALAMAAALTGCAGICSPKIQMGPDAEVTADGLHRVDHVSSAALYMRPDYAYGSYKFFTVGKTYVSLRPGSRILSDAEVAEMTRRFETVVRETAGRGRVEVRRGGPCVARVSLGLVDVDLLDPKALAPHGASTVVDSFGSITFVVEIRDSYTGDPLLRYGGRRRIQGGQGTGVDPAELNALTTTLDDFARITHQQFRDVLPRVVVANPVSCEARAGMPAPVGAP